MHTLKEPLSVEQRLLATTHSGKNSAYCVPFHLNTYIIRQACQRNHGQLHYTHDHCNSSLRCKDGATTHSNNSFTCTQSTCLQLMIDRTQLAIMHCHNKPCIATKLQHYQTLHWECPCSGGDPKHGTYHTRPFYHLVIRACDRNSEDLQFWRT